VEYVPFGEVFIEERNNTWNTPFLFNAKELDEETGLYYYGARYYDPRTSVFLGVDPLAEKYPGVNAYAYCHNNPMRYIDPTGMIVEDPDEIYTKQKEQITNNLSGVQQALKLSGLSNETKQALTTLTGEYQTMLNEFSVLENSEQIYKVFGTEGNEGGVYFENGTIMIGIGDQSLGLVGHELKHAYQFETGEISFKLDGQGFGSLYDISDETAAYNRERLLAIGVQFIQTPNAVINGYPIKMSNDNVRSFGQAMTPPAYQSLPNGPININSPEGQRLQRATFLYGLTGVSAITEAYKSMGTNYSQGIKSRIQ
jgi:RHS repeat-associated protein